MNQAKKNTYRATLVLANKQKYYGWSFTNQNKSVGELVFNTGMTGYQEIITDPSYKRQIVVFTYPEIGNTGINKQDNESMQPQVAGLIFKNLCQQPSNWRSKDSLIQYLVKNEIPHIFGIDTRALTKYLRSSGTQQGYICNIPDETYNIKIIEQQATENASNLAAVVSTKKCYQWKAQFIFKSDYKLDNINISEKYNLRIVVIDFGVKRSILNSLANYVLNIIVVPAHSTIDEILAYRPHGILLSNGPGDPKTLKKETETVKKLLKYKIPIWGICMGHQILSLALSINTFKLKFGHRGLNHPVGLNQQIAITSQNHGFAVDKMVREDQVNYHQFNYNDQTIASICHRKYPYSSVQYHPEANPGPNDTKWLFLHFIRIIQIILETSNQKNQ